MNPEIRTVSTIPALKQFIDFPFQLYRKHPLWVPPLRQSELAWLQAETNPAFQHSDVQLFTAWQGDRMVGRVAGIINHLETERLGERHARFGWLDFVDDKAVSSALLYAVEPWARERHCTRLKGPYGFNTLDKNGMLIAGFEQVGAMTTLYNYDYYPRHLAELGFEKELEWLEIQAMLPRPFPKKITTVANLILERYCLHVRRPTSKAEMLELGKVFFNMLLETYQHLPGFVPISEAQQAFYVKNYIGLLPPKFTCIVLTESGEPIGFGVTMPNLSRAMQKANGSLWPLGFVHLLLAQYFNDSGDVTLIGVKEEWRRRGVHSIIFNELGNTFLGLGYTHFNVNPMLEHNQNVLSLWQEFDHKVHKRRRTVFKGLR